MKVVYVNKEELSEIIDKLEDFDDIVVGKVSGNERLVVTASEKVLDKVQLGPDNFHRDCYKNESEKI